MVEACVVVPKQPVVSACFSVTSGWTDTVGRIWTGSLSELVLLTRAESLPTTDTRSISTVPECSGLGPISSAIDRFVSSVQTGVATEYAVTIIAVSRSIVMGLDGIAVGMSASREPDANAVSENWRRSTVAPSCTRWRVVQPGVSL